MIVEVKQLSKMYGSTKVLDDISFQIKKGTTLGLLGPNGAGKTSLIRLLTQITLPTSGQILYEGNPLQEKHQILVGYLPEERGLYKQMKVGEQLIYLGQLKGMTKKHATDAVTYWVEKFDIKSWWNKKIEALSKGMQQKVQFIATVMHRPPILILDEPFTGFDPINANLLKEEILALKKQGTTIIFSTHRMESVEELCDDIIMLHHSKLILNGTKQEILSRFKSSVFEITTTDEITALAEFSNISSQKNDNGSFTIIVKSDGLDTNRLVSEIIQRTTLISFSEKLPSMNEIFIKLTAAI